MLLKRPAFVKHVVDLEAWRKSYFEDAKNQDRASMEGSQPNPQALFLASNGHHFPSTTIKLYQSQSGNGEQHCSLQFEVSWIFALTHESSVGPRAMSQHNTALDVDGEIDFDEYLNFTETEISTSNLNTPLSTTSGLLAVSVDEGCGAFDGGQLVRATNSLSSQPASVDTIWNESQPGQDGNSSHNDDFASWFANQIGNSHFDTDGNESANITEPSTLDGKSSMQEFSKQKFTLTNQIEQADWVHQSLSSTVKGNAGRALGLTPQPTTKKSIHGYSSLPRRRSRYALEKSGNCTTAKFIPMLTQATKSSPDISSPFERWRNSPPEGEPASMLAIGRALDDITATEFNQIQSSKRREISLEHRGARPRTRRPRSVASSQSSRGSSSSRHSLASNTSTASVQPRRSNTAARNDIRDQHRPNSGRAKDLLRRFKCTFCCDQFKRKYDWARHEKSLHLDLEGWQCAPFGGIVASSHISRAVCAYCNILDPTPDHLDLHNHQACRSERDSAKQFKRKDHLVQHLRLVHWLETLPIIDNWKFEPPIVRSRCGFCNLNLSTWEERQDHLSFHFRKGLTMDNWFGDHDFDPLIQSQVRNAVPPYIIAEESRSMIPFSATSSGAKDHYEQISSGIVIDRPSNDQNTTQQVLESSTQDSEQSLLASGRKPYIELLTSHLARYAREKAREGIIPTDEMFQNEARKVMFQCEDPWNQTVADNSNWLSAFRKLQSLDSENVQFIA